MIHRWRYEVRGGHVHVRVFCGTHEAALGKCGNLVYRVEEFDILRPGLERHGIQFMEEKT